LSKGSRLHPWLDAFLAAVQQTAAAEELKRAALTEDLMIWTSTLTTAVVHSCQSLGWEAAAKWSPSQRIPKHGKEYLSLDVMALPSVEPEEPVVRWPLPLAVFELENHPKDVRVAYSLWKVLCVRAPLRVVVAYRPDWEQGRKLIGVLADEVIGGMTPEERSAIGGETVVIVGNRGDGETFPWGYFKFWLLDANVGRFDKIQ
jgi:hypothetical protein